MFDNIWFTYKARIRAQQRLAALDLHSQLLLVWYAVLGACLSIVVIRHAEALGPDTDIISAMFGMAVLVMSLWVTNRDFRGRSIEMRRNYLALHDLYSKATASPSVISPTEVNRAYQELLAAVENHSEMDDKYFRVFHTGVLSSRAPSVADHIQVYCHLVFRVLLLAAIYVGPLVIISK